MDDMPALCKPRAECPGTSQMELSVANR